MAYDIQMQLDPTGRTTTTNATSFAVAPPNPDLTFMQDELRRRMLEDRQLVDLQREALRKRMLQGDNEARMRGVGGNPGGLSGGGNPNAAQRNATEREQLRAAMLQAQAMTQQAPMRMVTGPGIIPGYTMDTNAMSGVQRDIFLPKNSTNDPVADEQARNLRKSGDVMSEQAWEKHVQDRKDKQYDPYGEQAKEREDNMRRYQIDAEARAKAQQAQRNNAYYGR